MGVIDNPAVVKLDFAGFRSKTFAKFVGDSQIRWQESSQAVFKSGLGQKVESFLGIFRRKIGGVVEDPEE